MTKIFCFLEYAYRNLTNANKLPNIPAQVIGYGVAYDIFKLLEINSNPVKIEWQGEMNMTYTYGGSLQDGRLFLDESLKKNQNKTLSFCSNV